MINRDRAWRRRKSRQSSTQLRDTKEWLKSRIQRLEARKGEKLSTEERKPHSKGKLTHYQDRKLSWAIGFELADDFST